MFRAVTLVVEKKRVFSYNMLLELLHQLLIQLSSFVFTLECCKHRKDLSLICVSFYCLPQGCSTQAMEGRVGAGF